MNKIFLIAFGLVIASCGPAKMLPTPNTIVEVQENKSKEVFIYNNLGRLIRGEEISFKEEKIIEIHGGNIRILDLNKLMKMKN